MLMNWKILMILSSVLVSNSLSGRVSNQLGMLGMRVSSLSHSISKVYPNSPAEMYGLKVGDIILKADGVNGLSNVDGEPYTYVNLTIKRNGETKEVKVFRLAKDEINFKQ